MAFENPAEAVYLPASSGKLYHTHFNDNYREDLTKAATECLKQIKFPLNALDKIGYSKMLDVVESGNPIKLVEMLRKIT